MTKHTPPDNIQNPESHLYLEEVLGEDALTKVRKWNEASAQRLESDSRFGTMQAQALDIVKSGEPPH